MCSNWEIKHISKNDGGKGINPCIVNSKLGLTIPIPYEYLSVFGFVSVGCELGIIGKEDKGSEDEQNIAISEILANELLMTMKQPNYWDVKDYLKNYKGKRRLGSFITPPKKTTESIKKVLEILDEDWQELNKLSNNRDMY